MEIPSWNFHPLNLPPRSTLPQHNNSHDPYTNVITTAIKEHSTSQVPNLSSLCARSSNTTFLSVLDLKVGYTAAGFPTRNSARQLSVSALQPRAPHSPSDQNIAFAHVSSSCRWINPTGETTSRVIKDKQQVGANSSYSRSACDEGCTNQDGIRSKFLSTSTASIQRQGSSKTWSSAGLQSTSAASAAAAAAVPTSTV